MKTTFLTRHDEEDTFDSIKWALETHLNRLDDPAFNFAELLGNPDSPHTINFWYSSSPDVGEPPDYVWYRDSSPDLEDCPDPCDDPGDVPF